MSNKFLQRAFLLCALLFFSFNNVHAYKLWKGVIQDSTHSALDEDVGIDDTVTVSKDVYIIARHSDVTVTVTRLNSLVQPASFYDGDSSTPGWAHVIFRPETTDRTIIVECDYDLTFSGATATTSGPDTDLIVTFSGQGTTLFKLKDLNSTWGWRGAQVSFEGFQKGGYADSGPVPAITKAGTRVYILMDQTETQAVTEGRNKVVFQRKEWDGSNGGLPVGVKVGNGSFITYLSTNQTGDPTQPGGPAAGGTFDGANGDFGSIAFDPTHAGEGRMYLRLARNVEENTAFGDGSVVVFGHFVPHFTEEAIRTKVYLNAVAGRKAIFRITDGLRYSDGSITDPTETNARGLLVINESLHLPNMANDPYQDHNIWSMSHTDLTHPNYPLYWAHDYAWSQAARALSGHSPDAYLNVQPGFILGTNGRMDIYHRTFLDYVASQDQTLNFFETGDFSTYRGLGYSTQLLTSSVFKFRNPSAFHVDGLNHYSNTNGYFDAGYDNYGIYNPEVGVGSSPEIINPNAEIFMYGDAKTLFRSGKNPGTERVTSSNGGRDSVYGPWYDDTVGVERYVYTFTIDRAAYNAQYIPSANVTDGEGRNVIDIEGPLTVRKFVRDSAPDRTYGATGEALDEAVINLPTVTIDETGREFDYITPSYITRPLTKLNLYQIYDSPSVFLNDHVELYDVIYANSDITKLLNTNPLTALPNFVGGERTYFNTTVFEAQLLDPLVHEHYQLPNFRLYNSRHDLHEHFVAAGCRFIVRDQTNYSGPTLADNQKALYGADADNLSVLKCYDHGDDLDTVDHAFGRLFMASCGNNKMSDGTSNKTVENCTVDVYRKNQINSPNMPAQIIKLSLQSEDDGDNPLMEYLVEPTDSQRAHHLILLNRPYHGVGLIDLGWTTTVGDNTRYPWEPLSSNASNHFDIRAEEPSGDVTNTPPATMSIDGNYFYFGGTDWTANKAVVPVTATGQGSVIYVNHGGRITITQPAEDKNGYDSFMDLPIAYKLWSYDGLRGIIDLPKDQVMYGYGFGRQPYNLNRVLTDAGSAVGIHLDTYNSSNVQGYDGRIAADRYSGEEYVLAWRNRVDNSDVNIPVKTPLKAMITRYTGIIDQVVSMPSNMLYFGAGHGWADVVTQLKVSGSTMADPMHLLIDGYASAPGYAWVKEIVSISSNPTVYGEGDHGIIFLRNGGRLGLGNNSWNSDSLNSWKLLGKDYLTISPAGNGTIDLNSDVFVVDRGAFVAEAGFGEEEVNRLTINLNGNDLYVPAGGELDLSSFGQNLKRQEIEFSGEGRVILGHGSVIRFPKSIAPSTIEDAPVLYFNDSTKLVIEDDPELGKGEYTTLEAADEDKVKIFGIGQIWLNKDAHFEVLGGSKVRVGSDTDTYYTHVRISIQRQGDFIIGDEQESGGSFEVGNPSTVTGPSGEESAISFDLILNGIKARTHLDRGAFMGFGVGMIDKSSDNMNGDSTLTNNPSVSTAGDVHFTPDQTNAWKVQTLYNVWKINLTINKGIFDHSNIFNGSDRKSSMLAIGPIYEYDGTAGSYTFELSDPNRSKVLAGGNLMLLDQETTTWINAWNFVDPKPREDWQSPAEDYGMYNILAADMIIQQQQNSNFVASTVTKLSGGGIKMVTSSSTPEKDFFDFISTPKYQELGGKMVNCGATQYRTYIDYVNTPQSSTNYSYATNAEQIYRLTGISVIGDGLPEDGVEIGVLGSTGTNEPVVYTVVNRR